MANASGQKPAAVEVQDNYQTLIDYDSGTNPVYIGKSSPGSATSSSVWSIRKVTYDANSNPTTIKLASGTGSFDKIWDDRTTYTYS